MSNTGLKRLKIMLSDSEKTEQWYKDSIDYFIAKSNLRVFNVKESRRAIIEYNRRLVEGKVDFSDLKSVLHPYKDIESKLKEDFTHKDILSPKINAILALDIKTPIRKRLVAVNKEATTMLEEQEFKKIREFVVSEIQAEIQKEMMKVQQEQQAQLQAEQEQQAQQSQASPQQPPQAQHEQQQAQIQQQQPQQPETPESIKKYMRRKYQTPMERLGNQVLNYLTKKEDIKYKFFQGLKDTISGNSEIFYVGVDDKYDDVNVELVDIANFNADTSKDFVEDGAWAVYRKGYTLLEFLDKFGEYLTKEQISKIENSSSGDYLLEDMILNKNKKTEVEVYHVVWKAMREIGILTYADIQTGKILKKLVSASYKMNESAGDLKLEKKWFPEVYEGYFANGDIYFNMRPIPGQFKDLENLNYCKLPYYGFIGDPTSSIISRVKVLVYLFDAVLYKMERLIAEDRGRKLIFDEKIIPTGLKPNEFIELLEFSPALTANTSSISQNGQELSHAVKEIDLSTTTDVTKYLEFAMAIRNLIGISLGVPQELEGKISPYMPVQNANNIIQSTTEMLQVLLYAHNKVKANVMQAMVEAAKVAWAGKGNLKLVYTTDDLTRAFFEVDTEMLNNTTYGIFIDDTSDYVNIKQQVTQLAHAALQNQLIGFKDVVKIIIEKDIDTMLDILEEAQEEMQKMASKNMQQQLQSEKESKQFDNQLNKDFEAFKSALTIKEIETKERERRITEQMKSNLLAASFNPEQDLNKDNKNDFVEEYENLKKEASKFEDKINKDMINLQKQKQNEQTRRQ